MSGRRLTVLVLAVFGVIALLALTLVGLAGQAAPHAAIQALETQAQGRAVFSAPRPGWCFPAKVAKITDGDTIVADITIRVHVRMLDCWAPETIAAKTPAERARGLVSKEYLAGQLPLGSEVVLFVPLESGDLRDSLTFGRVLGEVWRGDENMSEVMVSAGMATKTKVKPQ